MRSCASAVLSAAFSLSLGVLLVQPLPVRAVTSYANDFVDPTYVLAKDFSNVTAEAQATIVSWAQSLAREGPWSDSWPNCSSVGNTTALTDEEVWTTCPYETRDGQFNPDGRLVNDVGAFSDLADAVLYNALAWAIKGSGTYSGNVATFVKAWFLDADTAMNPNLAYAQMARGPDGQVGQHTGVLDLKCMAKLVSGVLILREGQAAEWTSDIDTQFSAWAANYTTWLTTASIALEEEAAENNHGTFYYNQLAALQVLVGDTAGAKATLEKYFTTQYMWQIDASGDQESLHKSQQAQTNPRPPTQTNAKIGAYIGYDAWNLTTSNGTTIKSALDYALTQGAGTETASELYPDVVAVGAAYGDAGGKYAAWMLANAKKAYPEDAQFFWNQPFSDSGLVKTGGSSSTGSSGSGNSVSGGADASSDNGAARGAWSAVAAMGAAVLVAAVL
ncbi:hypothetical protein TRAPUB_3256 [Trametes pubescens]|uniref:Alginate lyase domain-containing protein n=1 Tax=Trametes pubescens TaxID=154538 RepID=A0A1M2VED1_TRAPU|nr:hypothetical protein TRAPUB_3256 [Trametes pubescens]